jgi:hypothetical protein
VRHKYRRPPSHQAVVKQLDLFGLPGSKHPTPEFAWLQLPEKTRETVTGLMARLLIDPAWLKQNRRAPPRPR